ncbi:MAG TPA: choice-of-anchor tandem repeat GloVer-containing protein [Verrucomicrobiae bacterium]|nr:choice-of-anchor tandem repeat GloVer-containing protein [Verrucomicrobiae bacterium]
MRLFLSVYRTSARTILTIVVLTIIMALASPANAQYSVLYSFTGKADGGNPWAPLIQNSQGDLLGTASTGGNKGSGYGVFFKLKSNGTETILHTFGLTDGQRPIGQVVRDAAGTFYGVTYLGGTYFSGTIYKMDGAGNLTTLFNLHNYIGKFPVGGITIDSNGNLYGTTPAGGGNEQNSPGGDVFELSNAGVFTVLHTFTESTTDGFGAYSNLVRDSLGNLYGTAYLGGNYHCAGGCGVVFRVSAGGVEKVLKRFTGKPNDGDSPVGGLIRDHAGNFYGTTRFGGTADLGTVFKMDSTGKETVLYSFQGGSDGASPEYSNLVMDAAGNLYGTTAEGGGGDCTALGYSGCGTVFKLDTSGVETVLHSFAGEPTDGAIPYAGLTLGSDGNLYGTTYNGGTANAGTVFKIVP